jgi:mono/diheme cytochrome c family protein
MGKLTMRFGQSTVGVLIGAAFAVLGMGASALAQIAAGDATNGKRLYLADGCFVCHGRAGQGGASNYPVPPLVELEMPVESFLAYLRDAPNDMPAYSLSVLSDKDATDIYVFLRSLPGRKPPRDIPLLNQ